uniref:Ecdysteroid UDP-glucosyltransferase n=1 Tax=Ectropis obliqua nucleopolyhedrovirus TaxID=59376 RepID=S5THV7_9ABAC|nr:glycosyl transferase [Ectropis obliqua nucleopolyhedrovirus]QWV59710.1 ecdysteroid UDP-glucosyltransferase [Ectropis obliqua nucleopolyhedrovirus]UYO72918.1 ecdysteroid UDP-glucosyltransferase [Ectropis obliqua nucleopolyhedrovirus]
MSSSQIRFLFGIIVVCVVQYIDNVGGAKLLAIFTTPSYSHQSVFKVYIEGLAEKGHEIVLLKPSTEIIYDVSRYPNITEIDATLSKHYFKQLVRDSAVFRKRGLVADTMSVTAHNYMGLVKMISEQLKLPQIKNLIEMRTIMNFDLLITEAFMDYPLVMSHLFGNLPVVQISSGHGLAENFETMGAVSRHPIYYPNVWRNNFNNLNIWQTVNELYMELRLYNEFALLKAEQEKMMKIQFGNDVPELDTLRDNVKLLLVNTHAIFDNNRPVPPSVQYMGGLHLHKKQIAPLSSYVAWILNNSTKGAVYVSFGSTIKVADMDYDFLQMLLRTFTKLPYNVVWKYDGDTENIHIPQNVYLQTWFDQYSLLHHKNVKAFVTQGGVQSIDEAIDAGVPLIGLPMMGDQSFNTNKFVELEIGCTLDTLTVTSDQLVTAIVATVENPKFRHNLKNLRHTMRHQPITALNKAIWYTEHVINGKNNYSLKPKAANVSYGTYAMIHILVPFTAIFVMNNLQQLLRSTFVSI